MRAIEGRPRRPVLIVEDDEGVQDVLAMILEQEGYSVVRAGNGADALAQLTNGLQPCLILLDYHMPVMDGRTFRLKQLAAGVQEFVPVILCSADSTVRAGDLNIEAVFRKPVDFRELLRVVDRACSPLA